MVMTGDKAGAARPLLVLVAAWLAGGCLAKPAPPGGGDDDDDVPPGECPAGATKLPANLLIRRDAVIADVDRDGRDDVIVWGREGSGAGKASVFVVYGREPMSLGCHDLAFPLGDVEPLDVWLGEVTGDDAIDMLTVSRATDTYPVHLYRGLAAGGFEQVPDIQAPTKAQYGANVGGTMSDPLPVFVLGYTGNGAAEVIFGGLDEPFAGLRVGAGGLESDRLVRDDATPPNALLVGQTEGAEVVGTGEQRIVTVSDAVAVFANVARAGPYTQFARSGPTSLHGAGPQTVRFLRGMLDDALLGVTQVNDGDFDIIRARTTGAPEVMLLPADIQRQDVRDLALGHFDGGAGVDLVVLSQTFVDPELTVFRDLVLADPIGHEVLLRAAVPAGVNLVATGNFDGDASTPEQILLVPTSAPASGTCLHVVPGIPQACIVGCDVAACP